MVPSPNSSSDDDAQVGVNLFVLGPGEPMSMYHWEADQEGFLVLSGEALLIVENEERPLRQWDYFHCPPNISAHHRRCRLRAVRDPRARRAYRLPETTGAAIRTPSSR